MDIIEPESKAFPTSAGILFGLGLGGSSMELFAPGRCFAAGGNQPGGFHSTSRPRPWRRPEAISSGQRLAAGKLTSAFGR